MTLSKDYINSQVVTLGKNTIEVLEALADEALKERTVIYSNLRAVGRLNGAYDTEVIAATIAHILDTRAWEDYVDVDGARKSCESMPKWLEQNGVDIQLAEYCLKEKRPDVLVYFYEARDGRILTTAECTKIANAKAIEVCVRDERGKLAKSSKVDTLPTKTGRPKGNSYLLLRLERDFPEIYERVLSKELTVTKAAEVAGIRSPELRRKAQGVIKHTFPLAKEFADGYELLTEDFCKIAFHHALQTLTPELLETYKEELL